MKQINQIVVVDDDPNYSYLVEEALLICNPTCTLKAIYSGNELLTWLETNQLPNLIFLDINMPGSSGFDVLKALRAVEHYRHIPVVMLTTSEQLTDVHLSYEVGANAYITKPMNFNDLLQRINLFSRYWLTQAQPAASIWYKPDSLVYLN